MKRRLSPVHNGCARSRSEGRVSNNTTACSLASICSKEWRAQLVRYVSLVRSAATPLRKVTMGQGRRRHTGAPPKRGKAKKGQQPTHQKPRATGSLAVAAAAARLQQQRALDARASSEGRAPKELDVLERCYASWRRDPDILVVATCRDARSAKELRMACKALGAPSLALHAALSSQAAKEAASLRKGGVLAVTNDARDRLKQCLQRAKASKARFDNLAPPSGFEALPWPSELWSDLDDVKKRCALARKASSSLKDKKKADVARLAGSADATSKKKLQLLGMIHDEDAMMTNKRGETRTLARTKYMDGLSGEDLGAPWAGEVRSGAVADVVSRRVRDAIEEDQALAPGWRPNPEAEGDWGGLMGKPCGHNEVVMHAVRPFAPLEVLNTRCCSRKAPAPGNKGFDGCLEFLACRCRAKKTPTTVWDSNAFIHVSASGDVDVLPKQELLSRSVESLAALVPKLRALTVSTNGSVPPRELLKRIESE